MSRLWLALLLCSGTALAQAPDEDDIDPMPPTPPPVYLPPPPQLAPAPSVRLPYDSDLLPQSRTDIRLRAGAAARSLFDLGFGGLQLGLDVGHEGRRGAWYFTMDVLLGESAEHLFAGQGQIGFLGEAKLDRWRVGGGARFGLFGVRRITSSDVMAAFTFGPRFDVSYDLVWFQNGGAFLLGAELGFDFAFVGDGNPLMFDGNLFLGFRL